MLWEFTERRIGGPVAYAERAGQEALGGYPGDFFWGFDIAPVVRWWWHSGMSVVSVRPRGNGFRWESVLSRPSATINKVKQSRQCRRRYVSNPDGSTRIDIEKVRIKTWTSQCHKPANLRSSIPSILKRGSTILPRTSQTKKKSDYLPPGHLPNTDSLQFANSPYTKSLNPQCRSRRAQRPSPGPPTRPKSKSRSR